MAGLLKTFPQITLVANVPQKLAVDHIAVESLTVQAEGGNIGDIYIGDSTVTVNSGVILAERDPALIKYGQRGHGSEEFYVDEIYVVTGTTGNKARVAAFVRRP
jgi:hypothetical protein